MELFALMVTVTLAMTATADGEKVVSCCKTVSGKEFTGSITGYRLQERKLPCVKAVIFETKGQLMCSYWRAPWVRRKIEEFKRAQRNRVSATPSSTAPSTVQLSSLTSASFRSSAPESFASRSRSRESASLRPTVFQPSVPDSSTAPPDHINPLPSDKISTH
uniref:Chemokine interleukin-8-like domain-containing protein n=1 Tax=Scleropages formosus TaxID=113540 RepID=A0A8C9RFH2_SCLFO